MIDDSNAFDYNDGLDEYDEEQVNFNQVNKKSTSLNINYDRLLR